MKLNKMIVVTSLAAGSLVACCPAFGQNATPMTQTPTTSTPMTPNAASHMSAASRMDKLSQELGLSDEQKKKVQSIFDSEREQLRSVRQNTTMSTGEKRSKLIETRDSLNTKLQSVLTPQQFTKWQTLTHQIHAVPPNTPPGSKP